MIYDTHPIHTAQTVMSNAFVLWTPKQLCRIIEVNFEMFFVHKTH